MRRLLFPFLGYKFNIFYPDLIEPTVSPRYLLEPTGCNCFYFQLLTLFQQTFDMSVLKTFRQPRLLHHPVYCWSPLRRYRIQNCQQGLMILYLFVLLILLTMHIQLSSSDKSVSMNTDKRHFPSQEWEYNFKYGFKCVFDRGVLHLYFNFKRFFYRR